MKVREVVRMLKERISDRYIRKHFQTSRTEEMKYLIILEKTSTGYSAYSPDLPGCVSAGDTAQETEANMREAIEFHIEGMLEEGLTIPVPQSRASYVEVAA